MGDRPKKDRAPATATACGSAFDGLPLSGEPLPLELVNTTYVKGGVRGRLVDALTGPGDLDHWLALHRDAFGTPLGAALAAAGPSGRPHLDRFLELRQALRTLVGARVSARPAGPGEIGTVNDAARLAPHWQELGPGFVAVPRWPEPDPRLVALGEVATAGVRLLAGPDAPLLRACPAPGCVLYFVKTRTRREWCSAGCGNRVRVARHSRRIGKEDETGRRPASIPGGTAR
ncbi:CGNR zinc finger domain-containing protein [Streptomyces sp. NPDC014894]|uniref:CGNR zinc finger domain-containing protein n=1 Tax=unclassified Streptomyces TaxID=2593676 RepID=UPI0036FB981A